MITIAAAKQSTKMTARSQQLLFIVDGGNDGHCRWKRRSITAAAMVTFVDSSCRQRRRRWDGGTMTQWHWQQWPLWPMMAARMAVVVVKCAAVVDAATTIPSLALMAAAKMPLPLPPLTIASIDDDCYCCCQRSLLPLLHS
jgi:hypothetical protein